MTGLNTDRDMLESLRVTSNIFTEYIRLAISTIRFNQVFKRKV